MNYEAKERKHQTINYRPLQNVTKVTNLSNIYQLPNDGSVREIRRHSFEKAEVGLIMNHFPLLSKLPGCGNFPRFLRPV